MEWWIIATIVVSSIALLWVILSIVTWYRAKRVPEGFYPVRVDLDDYKGQWYEIATTDNWFERGCSNVTATYSNTGGTGELRVDNRCFIGNTWKHTSGTAYSSGIDGVFITSFFPGVYGNYTVLYKDVGTAVVATNDRKHYWVLARAPRVTLSKMHKLETILTRNGLHPERMNKTNQVWPPVYDA